MGQLTSAQALDSAESEGTCLLYLCLFGCLHVPSLGSLLTGLGTVLMRSLSMIVQIAAALSQLTA
jgi:hypothetical protein